MRRQARMIVVQAAAGRAGGLLSGIEAHSNRRPIPSTPGRLPNDMRTVAGAKTKWLWRKRSDLLVMGPPFAPRLCYRSPSSRLVSCGRERLWLCFIAPLLVTGTDPSSYSHQWPAATDQQFGPSHWAARSGAKLYSSRPGPPKSLSHLADNDLNMSGRTKNVAWRANRLSVQRRTRGTVNPCPIMIVPEIKRTRPSMWRRVRVSYSPRPSISRSSANNSRVVISVSGRSPNAGYAKSSSHRFLLSVAWARPSRSSLAITSSATTRKVTSLSACLSVCAAPTDQLTEPEVSSLRPGTVEPVQEKQLDKPPKPESFACPRIGQPPQLTASGLNEHIAPATVR